MYPNTVFHRSFSPKWYILLLFILILFILYQLKSYSNKCIWYYKSFFFKITPLFFIRHILLISKKILWFSESGSLCGRHFWNWKYQQHNSLNWKFTTWQQKARMVRGVKRKAKPQRRRKHLGSREPPARTPVSNAFLWVKLARTMVRRSWYLVRRPCAFSYNDHYISSKCFPSFFFFSLPKNEPLDLSEISTELFSCLITTLIPITATKDLSIKLYSRDQLNEMLRKMRQEDPQYTRPLTLELLGE